MKTIPKLQVKQKFRVYRDPLDIQFRFEFLDVEQRGAFQTLNNQIWLWILKWLSFKRSLMSLETLHLA